MTTSLSSNLKSINPSNLEELADLQTTPSTGVVEAVKLSRQAMQSWSALTLEQRLAKIENFRQLLIERKDGIAKLITLESGKPLLESYLELSGPLDTCLWLSKNAKDVLARQDIHLSSPFMWGKRHYLQLEPLGVVGIISPWNYPLSIPVMSMLMALAAGNTVVLKPSEKTPLIGLRIGELFNQAGFPANVVTVITGDGLVGRELASLELGRLIFTGSINTGTKIINTVAPNLTPLTLELGGKDPAIVLPDAPIERTAKAIVWGAFTNTGQACASIERVYLIKDKNNEALLSKIVEFVGKLRVGDPLLPTTEVGPLIDVQQFDHVVNQVEQAIRAGAKVLCGGGTLTSLGLQLRDQGLNGYFYEPTVITNVNHSMKIMQEETFGPVLPIMIVDSVEEAIKLANETHYGLTASIWSTNAQQAQAIANKLQAGTVFINDGLYTHAVAALPWGGVKKSGLGRSHSHLGLLDLVHVKHISVDNALWLPRIWWYPYHDSKLKAIRSGLEFLHSKVIGSKLTSLFGFLGNVFRNN